MFKGLQCYAHTACVGDACQDVLNRTDSIKTCGKDETKCWVNI